MSVPTASETGWSHGRAARAAIGGMGRISGRATTRECQTTRLGGRVIACAPFAWSGADILTRSVVSGGVLLRSVVTRFAESVRDLSLRVQATNHLSCGIERNQLDLLSLQLQHRQQPRPLCDVGAPSPSLSPNFDRGHFGCTQDGGMP